MYIIWLEPLINYLNSRTIVTAPERKFSVFIFLPQWYDINFTKFYFKVAFIICRYEHEQGTAETGRKNAISTLPTGEYKLKYKENVFFFFFQT